LYASLPALPTLPPEHFEELLGRGIQGMLQGRQIKIGSAEFVGQYGGGQGVYYAVDGVVKGYFEVKSRYRAGLSQVLAFFRKKRSVWLLSGDQNQEAAQLAPYFPNPAHMQFNRAPQDKLNFVKNLQDNGQEVLMIGDGLNDAGALQQSNVGIVLAEDTNNFTPACDGIVHADEFDKIPQFVRLAESGVRIVKQSYVIALAYNLFGLSYAVTGHLSPLIAAILMPVSSVSIVLFGIVSGNLRARRLRLR
jgi:Cu+-exporting ATPase